jgi:hypothetical protein
MPRLSLYKPEKGADYKFIDRQASEMFQAGGTDVYLHKYLGASTAAGNGTADQPVYGSTAVTNIQDLLFLENRDSTYDTEIYRLRGIYNVQNIDFNLSAFGLFIDNDTLYMTVHINDFIKYVGRKPISGDVIELPHLRDDFALNDFDISLPRYYVIEDVGRASEGFSATWYPHLYRLKVKRVTDNQKFASIFNQKVNDANGKPTDTSLRDLLSTYNKELEINNQLVAQAEADAPKSGFETRQFYTMAADPETGKAVLTTTAGTVTPGVPERSGYTGYLLGDGYPANGYDFGFGIQFPANAIADDFFLRTDFLPNRLFKFSGKSWVAVEDSVRMNMTNNDTRNTLKTGFINNNYWTYTDSIATDVINLSSGTYVINTRIAYNATVASAKYVIIKSETTTLEFDYALYPTIYSSYSYTNPQTGLASNCLRITLPIITPTNIADGGSAQQTYPPSVVDDGGRSGSVMGFDGILDDSPQQSIPFTGSWSVTLYNSREEQRQSISKVLKPKADF